MTSQQYLIQKQVFYHIIGRIFPSTHQKWPQPKMSIWPTLGWMSNPEWVRRIRFQTPSQLWQFNTNIKRRITQDPLLRATAFPYRLPRDITHQDKYHHLHNTTKWTKMHLNHLQILETSPIVWDMEFKIIFSAPTRHSHPELTIQIKNP